ncbi:hypothetical protein H4R33_005721 [Dimargaris cristalligena]|nr:hypothetical protein H4R33_005721 [Dimargaris cristalligena]
MSGSSLVGREKVSTGQAIRSVVDGATASAGPQRHAFHMRLNEKAFKLLKQIAMDRRRGDSPAPVTIAFGTTNKLSIGDHSFDIQRPVSYSKNEFYRRVGPQAVSPPTGRRTSATPQPHFELAGHVSHKTQVLVQMNGLLKERIKHKTQEAERERTSRHSMLLNEREASQATLLQSKRPPPARVVRPNAASTTVVTPVTSISTTSPSASASLSAPMPLTPTTSSGGVPLRTRLVQLLALHPTSIDSLVNTVKAKRDTVHQVLTQIAQAPANGTDKDVQWTLRPETYREVRIHDWSRYSVIERNAVIRNAEAAFDRLKLPANAPERSNLIPPVKVNPHARPFPSVGSVDSESGLPTSPPNPVVLSPATTAAARRRKPTTGLLGGPAAKLPKTGAKSSWRTNGISTAVSTFGSSSGTPSNKYGDLSKPILPEVSAVEYLKSKRSPPTPTITNGSGALGSGTVPTKRPDLHNPVVTANPKPLPTTRAPSDPKPSPPSISQVSSTTPAKRKLPSSSAQEPNGSNPDDDDVGRKRQVRKRTTSDGLASPLSRALKSPLGPTTPATSTTANIMPRTRPPTSSAGLRPSSNSTRAPLTNAATTAGSGPWDSKGSQPPPHVAPPELKVSPPAAPVSLPPAETPKTRPASVANTRPTVSGVKPKPVHIEDVPKRIPGTKVTSLSPPEHSLQHPEPEARLGAASYRQTSSSSSSNYSRANSFDSPPKSVGSDRPSLDGGYTSSDHSGIDTRARVNPEQDPYKFRITNKSQLELMCTKFMESYPKYEKLSDWVMSHSKAYQMFRSRVSQKLSRAEELEIQAELRRKHIELDIRKIQRKTSIYKTMHAEMESLKAEIWRACKEPWAKSLLRSDIGKSLVTIATKSKSKNSTGQRVSAERSNGASFDSRPEIDAVSQVAPNGHSGPVYSHSNGSRGGRRTKAQTIAH